jgi:hypothetical protein
MRRKKKEKRKKNEYDLISLIYIQLLPLNIEIWGKVYY